MTTTQNIITEVDWVDTTGYLAVGTIMEFDGIQHTVSIVQESHYRVDRPLTRERFTFIGVDEDTFMMFDEDNEQLGLVTDVRKAAFDEWEARELARAEAYDF